MGHIFGKAISVNEIQTKHPDWDIQKSQADHEEFLPGWTEWLKSKSDCDRCFRSFKLFEEFLAPHECDCKCSRSCPLVPSRNEGKFYLTDWLMVPMFFLHKEELITTKKGATLQRKLTTDDWGMHELLRLNQSSLDFLKKLFSGETKTPAWLPTRIDSSGDEIKNPNFHNFNENVSIEPGLTPYLD